VSSGKKHVSRWYSEVLLQLLAHAIPDRIGHSTRVNADQRGTGVPVFENDRSRVQMVEDAVIGLR
jgi:hypothetical protein